MKVVGVCSSCGRPAMRSCKLCGRIFCLACYDHPTGLCKSCRQKSGNREEPGLVKDRHKNLFK